MSDVIERLARVVNDGEAYDVTRLRVEQMLSVLNLTPSAAASLAEGRGVVVPVEPSPVMLMEGLRSATEGGPPPSDVYAQEFLGELAKMYRAMIAASQPKEGDT